MNPLRSTHKVNSFVVCYIHLVFSTKRREPYITSDIETDLFYYIGGIIKRLGCMPIIVNGMKDHVHILFRLSQSSALSDIVREVKKGSSAFMKGRNHPVEWQTGYSAFSVSASVVENVRSYIFNQKQHHLGLSYLDEIQWIERQNMLAVKDVRVDTSGAEDPE